MSDKTMVDVADKAVDKLGAVIDSINRLAPDVWAAAVRSERVEGIANVVVLVAACVATAVIVKRFTVWVMSKPAHDRDGPEVVLPELGLIVVGVTVVALALCNVGRELSRAVAPEYHAAAYFIGAVK